MKYKQSVETIISDGILTARMFNWTGRVIKFKRSDYENLMNNPKANFAGVYILYNETEPQNMILQGTMDMLRDIENIEINKKWETWDTGVLITYSQDMMTKNHIEYLEAKLKNHTVPTNKIFPEAVIGNMNHFLKDLFNVIDALKIPLFKNTEKPKSNNHILQLNFKAGFLLSAKGKYFDDKFILLKDSSVAEGEEGDIYSEQKMKFILNRTLSQCIGFLQLKRDLPFDTIEEAHRFVTGVYNSPDLEWENISPEQELLKEIFEDNL